MSTARTVTDFKWLDPICNGEGCRSLFLERALRRLAFAAMTSGGTSGPDSKLQAAIKEATDLIVHTDEEAESMGSAYADAIGGGYDHT
jgi:hypothetical protein